MREVAELDDRFMGYPLAVAPEDAIITAMEISAGEVKYCTDWIALLEEEEYWERPVKERWVQTEEGGEMVIREEGPELFHRMVTMRERAMERMAKFARMAIEVGVEERRTKIEEGKVKLLGAALMEAARDVGMSDQQRRELGKALRFHLQELIGEGEVAA